MATGRGWGNVVVPPRPPGFSAFFAFPERQNIPYRFTLHHAQENKTPAFHTGDGQLKKMVYSFISGAESDGGLENPNPHEQRTFLKWLILHSHNSGFKVREVSFRLNESNIPCNRGRKNKATMFEFLCMCRKFPRLSVVTTLPQNIEPHKET